MSKGGKFSDQTRHKDASSDTLLDGVPGTISKIPWSVSLDGRFFWTPNPVSTSAAPDKVDTRTGSAPRLQAPRSWDPCESGSLQENCPKWCPLTSFFDHPKKRHHRILLGKLVASTNVDLLGQTWLVFSCGFLGSIVQVLKGSGMLHVAHFREDFHEFIPSIFIMFKFIFCQ